MPTVKRIAIVPYSALQMYKLVDDIEHYPKFLPWCKDTQVHFRTGKQVKATIYIVKGLFKHKFTTINNLHEHDSIVIDYVDGPFKSLHGYWFFRSKADNMCEIELQLEYEFASKLVSLAIEPVFMPISHSMIEAFEQRAQELYGK